MSYRSRIANTSPGPPAASLSTQTLIAVGSAVRIAYGAGALLAPARMVAAQCAPDTHDLEDPRLLLRAFGGHQLVTGCFTLAAARSGHCAREAATLSLLIDALDVAGAILELRARGRCDRTVLGGIALSASGILTFATARLALSHG